MPLVTDGSPYPILLPASKTAEYSKLPDCFYWPFPSKANMCLTGMLHMKQAQS